MNVRQWLDRRVPPIPGDFREWMEPNRPDAAASVDSLAREAEWALDAAAEGQSRPRDGAFDLLAADGFLTYACEAALETGDPAAALRDLVRRFAS